MEISKYIWKIPSTIIYTLDYIKTIWNEIDKNDDTYYPVDVLLILEAVFAKH